MATTNYVMDKFQFSYLDTPCAKIAAAVVVQAVEDWRLLIAKKSWRSAHPVEVENVFITFDRLRDFFTSRLCALCLSPFNDLTGEYILTLLERELDAALGEENPDMIKYKFDINIRRLRGFEQW